MKMIQLLALLSTLQLCIASRGSQGGQLLLPSQRGVLAFSHHGASKRRVGPYHSKLPFPSVRILDRQPFLVLKSTENSNDTEETTSQTDSATGRLQNRRRRRKQQSPLANVASETEEDDDLWEEEEENSSLTPSFELKPRANAAVALEVKDVRAVVGLVPQDFANTPQQREGQRPSSTSKSPGRAISSTASSTSSSLNTADSLERMLADARQMQLQEDENDDDEETDGVNLPKQIRGLLSNIVTIDFFIICGFLLWFLAGVFSSSVLKNDDIQIAFNNNFSAIVQPALGVLMVLSVASAVFKDPEEENEQ